MNTNAAVTEVAKFIGQKIGTVNTTPLVGLAVDMSKYHRVDFILMTGTLNASETADGLVETDTVAAFNDSKATLKSTTAEVLDDDETAVISIKADDLPAGDRYARATMTGSGATGGPACILAIGWPRYSDQGDGSANVAGEVDQVVERVFAA